MTLLALCGYVYAWRPTDCVFPLQQSSAG